MSKKSNPIFNDLMQSLDEAKQIASGKNLPEARIREYEIAPAREFNPQQIKRIRIRLSFTQEMLAQFLDVSLGSVRNWEQGIASPLGSTRRLLEGLDKSANDLLGVYQRMDVVRIPTLDPTGSDR